MIQKRDDKKKTYEPFKARYLMMVLDEYLRIFILPQIPAEYKDFRETMRMAMDKAWRALFMAAGTSGRERQRRLMELKVEMMMVEVYLQEIRDVCYRGKEKKKLDRVSARRFKVCADRQADVMNFIWAWIKNEDAKDSAAKTQKTAGLAEGVDD